MGPGWLDLSHWQTRFFQMNHNRLSSNFPAPIPNQSLVGKLLVASPRADLPPVYQRAVILILQDSDEGVFGVVVNRQASPEMLMAWQKLAGPTFAAEKIVAGGPVVGPVLALHCRADLAEMEVDGGLFVSAQKEVIERLSEMELEQEHDDYDCFKIVMGAVSWSGLKLRGEIENGCWFVVDGCADQVFSEPDMMWEGLVRMCGRIAIANLTGIRSFPSSPLLN